MSLIEDNYEMLLESNSLIYILVVVVVVVDQ